MPRLPSLHPDVQRLLTDLEDARKHVPYATGLGRALDGVEKWVKYDGKHRSPDGDRDREWWASTLRLVMAVADLPAAKEDQRVRRILAPWASRAPALSARLAPVEQGVFRPFGRA